MFQVQNQVLAGAWFTGPSSDGSCAANAVSFRLYDDGRLVHTSSQLMLSVQPQYLDSGYRNRIDAVGVVSSCWQYYGMDDVAFYPQTQ